MAKVKCFFVSLLITSCISVQAQTSQLEYRPFAQDGKLWEVQVGGIKENRYVNYVDGDTLINGECWKKVYNYVGFKGSDDSYYAAIRDVDKKVYAIAKGSSKPRLLYDFDLKEGDVVRCGVEGNVFGCLLDSGEKPDTLMGFPFESYLKVERIDTFKDHGLEHRRFTLTLLDAYKENFRNGEDEIVGNVVWVEGVGSGAGPFSPWLPLPLRNNLRQYCEVDKSSIIGYIRFYDSQEPDAVNSVRYKLNENSAIYDLQGHRHSTKPQKGVFIQNGLKYVSN